MNSIIFFFILILLFVSIDIMSIGYGSSILGNSFVEAKKSKQEKKKQKSAKTATSSPSNSINSKNRKTLASQNIIQLDPVEYTLSNNDRILFLGDSTIVQGTANDYGLVNVFRREARKVYPSIEVMGMKLLVDEGSTASRTDVMRDAVKRQLDRETSPLMQNFQPTKIIFISGHDFLRNSTATDFDVLREELIPLFTVTLDKYIPLVFASTLLFGERIDYKNELDMVLEEFVGMTKRLALDFRVMHVDLFTQLFEYLSSTNIDNLPHSVITYDGKDLNEVGHALVAKILLKNLGLPQHIPVLDDMDIERKNLNNKNSKLLGADPEQPDAETHVDVVAIHHAQAMARKEEKARLKDLNIMMESSIVDAVPI